MQGFPEGWTEPMCPKSGYSSSRGQEETSEKAADAAGAARYRAAANAITVPVRTSHICNKLLSCISTLLTFSCYCTIPAASAQSREQQASALHIYILVQVAVPVA